MRKCRFLVFLGIICIFVFSLTLNGYADIGWPAGTMINNYWGASPGAGSDLLFRSILPFFQDEMGSPMSGINLPPPMVMYREHVHVHPYDGTAIVWTICPYHTTSSRRILGGDYDIEDLAMIGQIYASPQALFVAKTSPYQTFAELVEGIREKPLQHGYIPGSWMLLGGELFGEAVDGKPVGVPYPEGSGAIRAALIGGHLDYMSSDLYSTMGHVAEDVILMGTFSEERDPNFPDVPTVNEQLKALGYSPMASFGNVYLLCIDKRIKEAYPERYDKLVEVFKRTMLREDTIEMLNARHTYPSYLGPDELEKVIMEHAALIEKNKHFWVD